eukprot:11348.XXX_561440_562017_1 [CDS] Oithona nana genome sequencing.
MCHWITSVILLCFIFNFGNGSSRMIKVFEIQNSHPSGVNEGDKVTLKCTSATNFDFCAWNHEGKSCNFKYDDHLGHFRKLSSACIGNDSMINFVGSHSAHECKIELHNISSADNGAWSCFMQNSLNKSNDSSQIELLVKKRTEDLGGSILDAGPTELPSALWNDDYLNESEL